VEGPDRVGKTQISTRLAQRLNLPRFKCAVEKKLFRENDFTRFLGFDALLPQFVAQVGVGFVSDRSYISEYAYSKALERPTDKELLNEADVGWYDLQPKIVFLYRGLGYDDSDELVNAQQSKRVEQCYSDFYGWTCHPRRNIQWFSTDSYTDKTWVDDVCDDILTWLAWRDLPAPRDWFEEELHVACRESEEDNGPGSAEEEYLRLGYLYLHSGAYRSALETLTKVPRGLLPNNFWEHLGRLL
jgi:hypothetical protein